LKQASFEVDQYSGGLLWLADVYFGGNQTSLQCVFDLGSDRVVAQSSNCSSCKGNTVNSSDTGTLVASNGYTSISYGSADISGYDYNDTVCATSDNKSCVPDF
jgi:hypothetical protein